MNPISLRLLNQQLSAPEFDNPAEVVSHLGAMQAQEYRMMRWAVAMRTRRPSAEAFKNAFDRGEIIRFHLMRGTWQLVSAEDYWWMRDLCAPGALRVTKGWMHANGIDLSEKEVGEVRQMLGKAVESMGSATKEDIVKALEERGVSMDDHRLSYHIRMAELDGFLCSGSLQPLKATYSLSDSKIGIHKVLDRDEALMMMARKFFQSRQPATLEDFVWWSGLGIGDCRKGIALLGDEIHKEVWKGYEFYLMSSCRTRGFRSGSFLLIAPYDEYLIGYKSRDIVLAPEFCYHAHNHSGIFNPVISYDGILCGNWTPYKESCNPEFFIAPDVASFSRLDAEEERFRLFKNS